MSTHPHVPSRHIAWEQLQDRIREGVPFVHRIPAPGPGVPFVDIVVSEKGRELAMWVPCMIPEETIVSPLAEIDIAIVQTHGGQMIEVRTGLSILFQEIYSFFVSVSDKIQMHGSNPFAAINETLDGWRELLKARAILSEETQLGLRGELYLLRLLTTVIGDQALAAWTGPLGQPHDFRVGDLELEAKATRGAVHAHIINGLRQLEPSPGHRLYVFSVRLAPAGAMAGTTLPDDIEETRLALGVAAQADFGKIMRDRFGYRKEHAGLYAQRLQLAGMPCLIPVDESCPRLSALLLASVPHRGRIGDVRYRANFEGLGFPQGSPEFQAVICSAIAAT